MTVTVATRRAHTGLLLAASWATFAASTVTTAVATFFWSEELGATVQSAGLVVAYIAAAGVVMAARPTSGSARTSSNMITLALLAWAAGFALWVRMDGQVVTGPSWSDVWFLAYYPLMVVGVVCRVRSGLRRRSAYLWVDGWVAVLGTATIGSVVLVVVQDQQVATTLTALLYPCLDIVLVAVICGAIALHHGRCGRTMWVLLAAFSTMAIADMHYALGLFGSGYELGEPGALGWLLGAGLIARSVSLDDPEPEPPTAPAASAALSTAFAAIALGVLVLPGSFHWVTSCLAVGTVGICIARMRMTARDLTGLLAARHQAMTDELTGLANRRHLRKRLEDLIEQGGAPASVMLLDLDRFKEVNDIFGHETGDRLLEMFARRAEQVLPPGGVLARLGGDEFVWLLPGHDAKAARKVAHALGREMRRPFDLHLAVIDLEASIGIAEFPRHGEHAETLLRHADIAMYRAKSERAGIVEYDRAFDPVVTGEYQLAAEARRVSFADEFVLRFQPLVSVAEGRLAGAEALVRWRHPRLGMLAPDAFLDVLMRTGRGRELTDMVVEAACEACAGWRRDHSDAFVAVNLCGDDLTDPELADRLDRAVRRHGLDRSALHVEVPETLATQVRERTNDAVGRLRERGYIVALDDFGTGSSSLSQLRELGPHEVKLDKSFGLAAPTDETAETILRATIELGHALGMKVTVEGVDHPETYALLAELGCDFAQGFLLSTPISAHNIPRWSWVAPPLSRLAPSTARH